ncbi:MAG: hypothetical protein IKU98_05750 [Bacteroidaceae bacterium]|nr:hypothetical protein [Bacteroidaceae bacterium]
MILHYLSLAWQQLEKYRLQSVVSIVSLAIGFACFALASMWIKYNSDKLRVERIRTYDAL